jgi:glycosyltransferase involved in cell wall biosynthesis
VFSFMGIPDRSWLVARRERLRIVLRAISECDAVVALSRAAADAFARDLGVQARVIHPGVDVARFTPGGERSPEPSILCLASLDVAEKRVHLLLDALPLVRRAEPEATLMLQRPREPRIAAAATAIAGVELVDPEPPALPGLYRRAWISALPSRSDAFGLVLAESLACGTAVVGSDRGGIREIVDRPAVGRIFSGEHPRDVAAALLEGLELARDPVTAAACRARAEELSVERMVAEYEALYRELV